VNKKGLSVWKLAYSFSVSIKFCAKKFPNFLPGTLAFYRTLLRAKYVPSLVKIHLRMLILVFTSMLCGKNLTLVTLKINRVPDSRPADVANIDTSVTLIRVFKNVVWKSQIASGKCSMESWSTCSQGCYTVKNVPSDLDLWPMTLKINTAPESPKD
jgi:hypothetical protein